MSEKTIAEIAAELGVSKTAVRKKIDNLGLRKNLQTSGNLFLISETDEVLIKSAFYVESRTNRKPRTRTCAQTNRKRNPAGFPFSKLN